MNKNGSQKMAKAGEEITKNGQKKMKKMRPKKNKKFGNNCQEKWRKINKD